MAPRNKFRGSFVPSGSPLNTTNPDNTAVNAFDVAPKPPPPSEVTGDGTPTGKVTMPDGRVLERDQMTPMQIAAHRLGLTKEQVQVLLQNGYDVLRASPSEAGMLQHMADKFITQKGPSVSEGEAPTEAPEPEPEAKPEPKGEVDLTPGPAEPDGTPQGEEPPDLLDSLRQDYVRSAGMGIAMQDEADLEMAIAMNQRGHQTFNDLTTSEGYRQNQYLIDELNDLYQKGGLTDVTRAQLETNRRQALQTAMAQQGFVADDMAERGLGGGAAEAFGRFGAANAAAERQQMADLEAAAFGQQSAVDALQQAGYAGDRLHDKFSTAVGERNKYLDTGSQLQHDAASRLGQGIQDFFEMSVMPQYANRVIHFDTEVANEASGGRTDSYNIVDNLTTPGDASINGAQQIGINTSSGGPNASTGPGEHDTSGVSNGYNWWDVGTDWSEDHQAKRERLEKLAIEAGSAYATGGASAVGGRGTK